MTQLTAAQRVYGAGYRKIDAYSPFSGGRTFRGDRISPQRVALVCLIGGLLGRLAAFVLAVVDQHRRLSGQHWREGR